MVVRVRGMRKPELLRAENTRSSDSFTAASGRPTRKSLGSPRSPVLTSTCTDTASMPTRAAEQIAASICGWAAAGLHAHQPLLQLAADLDHVGLDRGQVGVGL